MFFRPIFVPVTMVKVLIKQMDYVTGNNKIVGSFTINKDDWIAYFLSKDGKKVLKQIGYSQNVNHPTVIHYILQMYLMLSDPANGNPETDFYIYEPEKKEIKSHQKLFFQKYLPNQLRLEKVTK